MDTDNEDYDTAALDQHQQDERAQLENHWLARGIGYNEFLRNTLNTGN